MNSPLVTVILVTYNQAEWAAEAVHSVLNQDYENIEFIIADDCSTDITLKIIAAIIGGHSRREAITFLPSSENLGITGNLSRALAVARGDLVVLAAGDDVSKSNRVSVLVEKWEEFGRPPAIGSSIAVIDESGVEILSHQRQIQYDFSSTHLIAGSEAITKHYSRSGLILVLGATLAYSRQTLDWFGRELGDCHNEDLLLLGRALLLGGCVAVADRLVLHRVTDRNVSIRRPIKTDVASRLLRRVKRIWSNKATRGKLPNKVDRRLALLSQQVLDIELALSEGLVTESDCDAIIDRLNGEISELNARRERGNSWWSSRFAYRYSSIWSTKTR